MIVLRDMIESDIEDYVRWFTAETEWMDWDAPWENEETTPEAEREGWTEYFERIKTLPKDALRWKFEIELDGRHVGWVSRYFDLDYVENPEKIPAVASHAASARRRYGSSLNISERTARAACIRRRGRATHACCASRKSSASFRTPV